MDCKFRKHCSISMGNFFEIVKDEFMKLGEQLPPMGKDEGELAQTPYIKALDREIDKYEMLEDQYENVQ